MSNIVNTVKSESNVTLTVAAAPIALVTNDTNEEIPTTEVSTVTVPATTVRIPPLKYLLKYLYQTTEHAEVISGLLNVSVLYVLKCRWFMR